MAKPLRDAKRVSNVKRVDYFCVITGMVQDKCFNFNQI